MLVSLSILSILGILLLSCTLLFCMMYIVFPLFRMFQLKREGAEFYFYPVIGLYHYWKSSLKTRGDAMAFSKESSKANPNQKFLLTNLDKSAVLFFRQVEYVQEFFKHQDCYKKSGSLDCMKLILGDGMLLSEGSMWKRHRKIISNSFHFGLLKANIASIREITREHFNTMSQEDLRNFNVLNQIQAVTGETVGLLFFGKNLNNYTCEGKLLTICLADILADLEIISKSAPILVFGPKIMNLPVPKYKAMMQRITDFRNICKRIIDDRRKEPEQRDDMLGSLLQTQKSKDLENVFSDEEIIDEFVTFFAAGMDTTGHLIGMSLYLLTLHPQYLQGLQEEREVSYNLEVNADSLQKMELLHCVLKETLRHYNPPSGVMLRDVVKPHRLLDVELKKGDLVKIDFYSIFVDGRYFENPDEYNPLRWKENNQKGDVYTYIPFSAGPRNCIGQHLAIIESKIIMSEFLEMFDYKMKDPNYKLELIHRFLYEPVEPLVFELTPKKAD